MSRVLAKESLETEESQQTFTFLSQVPLELRILIYGYLLPPRRHIVVTQTPYSGYFYNTSSPLTASYPFGRSPTPAPTAYKILTKNSHRDFPSAVICPAVLRTCKQIREEAEPVLYGSKHVEWDFGTHFAAAKTFWEERSQIARENIRTLRIAKEVSYNEGEAALGDARWLEFCYFLSHSLPNLRSLDLTLWSSPNHAIISSPISGDISDGKVGRESQVKEWREWSWTRNLLMMDNLVDVKITYWDFKRIWNSGETKFDSWLAQRMVADTAVKERIIRERGVVERIISLPGLQA